MKNHHLFVCNWKMNLSFSETIELATENHDDLVSLATTSKQRIVLCPSTESLYPLIQIFKETPITLGSQTVSSHTHGPFTGQIPAQNLQEVGCTYCIIGHSETKKEYEETPEQIAKKCVHLLDYDVIPIVCIGETEEEHSNGKTLDALAAQLNPLCKALNSKTAIHSYIEPIIAYEPVWAIGTGNVANADHVDMVLNWLAETLQQNTPSIPWKLLYGGSISPENIEQFKKITKIEGFLLGNASLDFQKLKKIVQLSIAT